MIASFATLSLAAALSAAPLQASSPDHHRMQIQEVNIEKPHKGAWGDQIVEAARVPEKWRAFAACVCDRESGGTLGKIQSGVGARNPNSSASGRWQFLNSSWNEPLGYIVSDRLKKQGVPKSVAKKIRVELQAMPIYEWHGYFQDVGFVAVVTDGGWRHWNGHSCNGKRP